MSARDDGGSAFPTRYRDGMSLRDWFAGQIMAAAMVNATNMKDVPSGVLTEVSSVSYRIADAMLAARSL